MAVGGESEHVAAFVMPSSTNGFDLIDASLTLILDDEAGGRFDLLLEQAPVFEPDSVTEVSPYTTPSMSELHVITSPKSESDPEQSNEQWLSAELRNETFG